MKIALLKEVGTHPIGTVLNIGGGYGQQLIAQKIAEKVSGADEGKKEDKALKETKELKDPKQTKEVKEKGKTK